jgi:hypothetical protein
VGRYPEVRLSEIRLRPVAERETRVQVADFGEVGPPAEAAALVERLPRQVGGLALREARDAIVRARRDSRPVVILVGAHVIKVGASPYLVRWMERGVVTHLALHGAGAIHDLEIARFGKTSEDVEENLHQGVFGLVEETGRHFHHAARQARERAEGLGEAIGRLLSRTERRTTAPACSPRPTDKGFPPPCTWPSGPTPCTRIPAPTAPTSARRRCATSASSRTRCSRREAP